MTFLTSRVENSQDFFADHGPGLVLVGLVTAAAYGTRFFPLTAQLSPMIIAIILGILYSNTVGNNASTLPGISLSGKRLLRFAVALLGLQISLVQLQEIGVSGVVMAALVLGATYVFTIGCARILGVDRKLSSLIAAGTSVCGASAIAATSSVTGADDEDVAYAVACITLFGTIAMFLFPLIGLLDVISDHNYGLWIGLSVHEVAQVVGAGFQKSDMAGETAVVTKLARVMMLAPLIVILSGIFSRSRATTGKRTPFIPFFVVGFILLAAANSLALVPEGVRTPVVTATPVLLTAAMGALGLGTNLTDLRRRGLPPLLLSGLASVFIAVISFVMVVSIT